MAFKMKGSAFKLNNVATKSALKHKDGTDHKHGAGFLPESALEKRNALKRRLIAENDGVMNEDIQSQLRKFTQDYKQDVKHESMPTNKEIQATNMVSPGTGNVIDKGVGVVPDKDR